jgi:hypothetical protein
MFDAERFTDDCLAALKEKIPHAAVKEIVARAQRMGPKDPGGTRVRSRTCKAGLRRIEPAPSCSQAWNS